MWLGRWANNHSTPLHLNWTRDPVKILGIYFSYGEKENNHFNFELKTQNLQTKFDKLFLNQLKVFVENIS